MTSLDSPLSLCDRLGLVPTQQQQAFLTNVGDTNLNGEMVRAAALYSLWYVLRDDNARVSVICSNSEDEGMFFDFLHKISCHIDSAIARYCRWPKWNCLAVVGRTNQKVKGMKWHAKSLRGLEFERHLVIQIGAGHRENLFVESSQALEHTATEVVRLW